MAAGVLFRSSDGRVLLVEPSYKQNWEIPGGVVEADESPWAAAARELVEELGTERPLGRLLVVDHVQAYDGRPDAMVFVFDGGVVTEADVTVFTFSDGEILSAGLYTLAQTRTLGKPMLAARLEAAVEAVEEGIVALCEHGKRVA
jgi:ADP-ribose pyrophosphatase YjhB (NUDIX family)